MKKLKMSKKKIFLYFLLFLFVLNLLNIIFTHPSNDRNWNLDQKILPYAFIKDNLITINNIRNFSYYNETSFNVSYYNKTFDLDKIKKVSYIVEPFSSFEGLAHTFLSFEFETSQTDKVSEGLGIVSKKNSLNNSFISISVEIRKEMGESYSPIKGLFRKYEIMYVIGDENDLIKLRTNIRADSVTMYPIKANKSDIKLLFLDMINKTNKLYEKPEFYNTITNTCTTTILEHVNKLREHKILYSWKIFLPGFSDEIIYNLGLIDTNLSFVDAKKKFNINFKAIKYANSEDFSKKIREY